MICGRCRTETGNENQGHYWSWCKKARRFIGFHFCCPDRPCEVEAK